MNIGNPLREIRTIKTLLSGAEDEARAMGDPIPGVEHLLLSALALPDGSAQRAFERVGADPGEFRGAIETQHAEALGGIGLSPADGPPTALPPSKGVFRATPPAQAAFRAAAEMAKSERPSRLIGAHVVAAVADVENGTAARTLDAMGIDRCALRRAARDEIEATRAAPAR